MLMLVKQWHGSFLCLVCLEAVVCAAATSSIAAQSGTEHVRRASMRDLTLQILFAVALMARTRMLAL